MCHNDKKKEKFCPIKFMAKKASVTLEIHILCVYVLDLLRNILGKKNLHFSIPREQKVRNIRFIHRNECMEHKYTRELGGGKIITNIYR